MCYLWMNHIFQQSHTSFGGGIVKEKIFSLKTSRDRKSISMFGAYKPRTKSFYWKSAEKSDKQTLKAFLHPLSVHCPNSKTVIVLDNASIHTCRYIKDFAERNPNIKIFTLPTYSPEYNPVKQVWKWLKPRVCGLPKAMNVGYNEIVSRIRKTSNAWTFGRWLQIQRSASRYGKIYCSIIYDDTLIIYGKMYRMRRGKQALNFVPVK